MGECMDQVNKTLYIPLYGKAYVSQKGIILEDKKAEEIWSKEGFTLQGKSSSKWLAYYMGMRSRVFDEWVREKIDTLENAVVLHLGCGLDSRVERVNRTTLWYDVDFPQVIEERKKYYTENEHYHMIESDVREEAWLKDIPSQNAIVIMEGISMYLTVEELRGVMKRIHDHFESVHILMDQYTVLAAKASKYKNPINDVGVTVVYGIDDPRVLEESGMVYVREHELTPRYLIEKLQGVEKVIFQKLYAGSFASKLYKLYEYRSK
ncbi:MAG: class I SAM-dependent methyltransferase [Erysipelotrichales bacterium]|nr:class I SAM-dependent methyltransferase [Erysipelotrichales bacterium]